MNHEATFNSLKC